MDAATRAIPWQIKHNKILSRITPQILQSDETLTDIADELSVMGRDYTFSELAITGTQYPMNWDISNPEHAIIIANRADIRDSEDRLRFQLKVRSENRQWDKHMKEIDPFNLGKIKLPDVNVSPAAGVGLILAAGAIIVTVLILATRK